MLPTVADAKIVYAKIAYACMPELATAVLLSIAMVSMYKNFTNYPQNYADAFNHLLRSNLSRHNVCVPMHILLLHLHQTTQRMNTTYL